MSLQSCTLGTRADMTALTSAQLLLSLLRPYRLLAICCALNVSLHFPKAISPIKRSSLTIGSLELMFCSPRRNIVTCCDRTSLSHRRLDFTIRTIEVIILITLSSVCDKHCKPFITNTMCMKRQGLHDSSSSRDAIGDRCFLRMRKLLSLLFLPDIRTKFAMLPTAQCRSLCLINKSNFSCARDLSQNKLSISSLIASLLTVNGNFKSIVALSMLFLHNSRDLNSSVFIEMASFPVDRCSDLLDTDAEERNLDRSHEPAVTRNVAIIDCQIILKT